MPRPRWVRGGSFLGAAPAGAVQQRVRSLCCWLTCRPFHRPRSALGTRGVSLWSQPSSSLAALGLKPWLPPRPCRQPALACPSEPPGGVQSPRRIVPLCRACVAGGLPAGRTHSGRSGPQVLLHPWEGLTGGFRKRELGPGPDLGRAFRVAATSQPHSLSASPTLQGCGGPFAGAGPWAPSGLCSAASGCPGPDCGIACPGC